MSSELPPGRASRQPVFRMAYQERHSRLTTFFRPILAIPPTFVVGLWSIALLVTVPVSWFALLFTGRYPRGLYDFHASFARYDTFVSGYSYLASDRWPGFSGTSPGYPVQLTVGPPLERYDRVKVALRIVLVIVPVLIAYAMGLVVTVAVIIAWFAIVFTGKLPQGIFQMLHLGMSYVVRATPYYLLLTEDWPQFTQAEDREVLAAGEPALPAPPTGSGPRGDERGASELPGGFEPPSPPAGSS